MARCLTGTAKVVVPAKSRNQFQDRTVRQLDRQAVKGPWLQSRLTFPLHQLSYLGDAEGAGLGLCATRGFVQAGDYMPIPIPTDIATAIALSFFHCVPPPTPTRGGGGGGGSER